MTTTSELFTLGVPDSLAPAGASIRVAGERQRPLFHLLDTCAVLGLNGSSTPRMIAQRLGEGRLSFVTTSDETQREGRPSTYEHAYLAESDWYKVILQSRKPAAEPLVDWICGEVLPSIRLHGCYPPPGDSAAAPAGSGEAISDVLPSMIVSQGVRNKRSIVRLREEIVQLERKQAALHQAATDYLADEAESRIWGPILSSLFGEGVEL